MWVSQRATEMWAMRLGVHRAGTEEARERPVPRVYCGRHRQHRGHHVHPVHAVERPDKRPVHVHTGLKKPVNDLKNAGALPPDQAFEEREEWRPGNSTMEGYRAAALLSAGDVQARGGGGVAERLHASGRHLVAVVEAERGERGQAAHCCSK
jgi:hypothetical protein